MKEDPAHQDSGFLAYNTKTYNLLHKNHLIKQIFITIVQK